MDILIEELNESLWTTALRDGRLEGLEVDPAHEEVRWGSIYWAKVKTIDKALDAVFIDLDGENTGILYNQDVRYLDKNNKVQKGGSEAISKRFQPGDMIPVQAKTAYISKSPSNHKSSEKKIPQMSMDITIPGRYLIFCSMLDCNRISARIRDKKLRKQLHKMMETMEDIKGCILRLAAAHTQSDVLIREGKILKSAWEQIQTYFTGDSPTLVALGPDAIQRTLSDQAAQNIERIEVVTMEHYREAEEWCSIFAPDLVTKIDPIELENATDDLALFHYRDIIGQIENLFQSYAILAGGGNIIIQTTSALTAIDVNKANSKLSHLDVNIEAAQEIARQIRLRNTGGIIIIDFLKMQDKKSQGQLIAAIEAAIDQDPCTVQIHGLTNLGLIELTRKRRTPSLEDRFEGDFG